MAPKSKGKAGKAVPAPHQPKTLSSRVRQVVQQSQAADEQHADEQQQQQLIVPIQMAFTSLLSTSWTVKRAVPFVMVDCHAAASPLWRDSFVVSAERSWLMPPLHKYLPAADAEQPAEQLLVKLWQEHRFRERLQLGHRLLHEFGDVTGAAMLLMDIAPGRTTADWVTRIQMACAAYKHAWFSRTDTGSGPYQVQDGSLPLQDVRWLRAQWLLARTLSAALTDSKRRTSGLLGMVLSAMIGFAPEDPLGNRFFMQRALAGSGAWGPLLEVTEPIQPTPKTFRELPRNPYGLDTASMATAYNRALACYNTYGPDDEETQAALAAAFDRDPARWVPVLLAGGALAVPGLPPLVALGSKEEASAYCRDHGSNWWMGFSQEELLLVMQEESAVMEQAEAVTWLLEEAGLDELAGVDSGMSQVGVLMYNMNMPMTAIGCSLPLVVDEMNVRINGSMAVGSAGSTKPEEAPDIARSCLVLLCVLASSTQNLPPVDTCASSLWAPTAKLFRIRSSEAATQIKGRLCDSSTAVCEIAQRLLAQCRTWQQQERRRELQGSLELVWPAELLHWERTLEELGPARARMLWQAGQVRSAKDVAAQLLERQEQLHTRVQSQLSSSTAPQARDAALAALLRGTATVPGPVLRSLPALREMQEFLNQQAVEAARRSLSHRGRSSGARGGGSSHSRAGAFEGQFGRYEEATPEALQRFANSVLEAAGGAAAIKSALDIGRLLQAYSTGSRALDNSGSSSDEEEAGGEDSSDDYEDGPAYGSRQAELGIAVLEQLLSTPMRPMPARTAAGQGAVTAGAAAATAARGGPGLRQQGAAGSSSSCSVPSIIAALRASLDKQPWLGAMGGAAAPARGSGSSSNALSLSPREFDILRAALRDPVKAALGNSITNFLGGAPLSAGEQAAVEAVLPHLIQRLAEDVPLAVAKGLQEAAADGLIQGGSSSSGTSRSSPSRARQQLLLALGSSAEAVDVAATAAAEAVEEVLSGALGQVVAGDVASRGSLDHSGRVVRQRLLEPGSSGSGQAAAAAAAAGTGAGSAAAAAAAAGTGVSGAAAAGTQEVPQGVAEIVRLAGRTLKQGSKVVLAAPAAAAAAAAATAAQSGAGSSSGSSRGGGSSGWTMAVWDPYEDAAVLNDPGPGFVFGSNPEAAAAAASAAFDSVLNSYTGAAPSPAAQGPSSSSSSRGAAGHTPSPPQAAAAAGGASQPGVLSTAAGTAVVASGTSSSTGAGTATNGAAAAAADAAPGVAGSGSSTAAAGGAAQGTAARQGTAAAGQQSVAVPAAPGGKVCACCGGTFPKVYRCSGCQAVGVSIGYCSAACQKTHWKAGHKKVCSIKAAAAQGS